MMRFPFAPLLLVSFLLVRVVGAAPAPVVTEFIYEKAPFPSCHASTIVEAADGTLLAAWFGGTAEKNPDVGIWVSRHVGSTWSAPVEVANGVQHPGKRYPTWNPVLFQPKTGPLLLFYKVGPSPSEWWGMLTTSSDAGKTWSEPRRLPEDILGPIKNKPVQLPDGSLFCPSSSEDKELGWRVHFEVTRDLGRTWELVGPINTKAEFNIIQPSVLFHTDGRLQVLCRSKEGFVMQSWSSDHGQTWSKPAATPLPNPNSGTDAVTLKDGRQLIVYNHTPKGRTPLTVSLSRDGQTWSRVLDLETEPGEYSYPAVIQTADGAIHITYTWRREKIRHVVLDPRKLE
jgi:predicted neuraminidase